MKRVLIGIALVVMFAMGTAGYAQTPPEDVKATMQSLLTSLEAKDATAARALLHETFLAKVDMEGGLWDRAKFIAESVKDEGPKGLQFGEYEPKIYGDAALVDIPLIFPAGEAVPPGIRVNLAAILIRAEGAWKVLGMAVIVPLEQLAGFPLPPGESPGDFQAMADGFEAFAAKMGDIASSGDLMAFLDLCDANCVMAGPYGMNGEMVAVKTSELKAMAGGGFPPLKVVPVAGEEEATVGVGVASMAATTEITFAGQGPLRMRNIALATWDAEARTWRVFVAVGAPAQVVR